MIIPPYSITGLRHKHFDDGVDIEVTYTRNNSHVTHINSIRYSYNLEYMEVDYNNRYVDFINSHPKVRISKNMIDVAPRVRQMMNEVESELRLDRLSSLTDIESSIDIGIADGGPRTVTAADFNTEPVTIVRTLPETYTGEPVPKRQRTRWELLELD